MKDGEPDFSKYTGEQIDRSLRKIDRERYPLNYARLLAARQALPPPADPAAIEQARQVELINEISSGEVRISAAWTWLFNPALPLASAATLLWLARKYLLDPATNTEAVDVRNWFAIEPLFYVVFVLTLLLACAWFPLRIRRVVVREGQLEVRGFFARETIGFQEIERVRWNAKVGNGESVQAIIDLRTRSWFGRRIRFFPRSLPIMRALAAHVSAVQGRKGIADPALKSAFYVGAADP